MRELRWLMQGFLGVVAGLLLILILQAFFTALQQATIATGANVDFTSNWSLIAWLLEISGWFYVIYVAEKETWVIKEIFVSLGMILAGMILDPSSMIIGLLAIIVIFFRKI